MANNSDAIRKVLATFTRAIRNKDAAAATGVLADDVVTFDLAPPLRMGPETARDPARLREWFETWKSPITSESHDLKIEIGGDIAYAHCLQHMTGTKKDGE